MTHYAYGRKWNERLNFMLDHVDERRAKATYDTGDEITIASGNGQLALGYDYADRNGQPATWSIYAHRKAKVVQVRHYNEFGSLMLRYSFRPLESLAELFDYTGPIPDGEDRWFLTEAAHYTYPDQPRYYGEPGWTHMDVFMFRPNGWSKEVNYRTTPDGDTQTRSVERTDVDISINYEPLPTFGHWDSLTRIDRTQPPTQ